MANLTEKTITDRIEITETGVIQVRENTKIFRDDVEVSSSFFRYSLEPGADLTGKEKRVVDVANLIWTPEVISAYQQMVESQNIAKE